MGFSQKLFRMQGCLAAIMWTVGFTTSAHALGLGDISTSSRLGDRLHLEIPLSQQNDERLDAGCIRLKKPRVDEGLPWLSQGSYGIRRGSPSVLTISSSGVVSDPVIQVGVYIGCGFEVQRDYTLFLSPRMAEPQLPVASTPLATARAAIAERTAKRRRSYVPPVQAVTSSKRDSDIPPPFVRKPRRTSTPKAEAAPPKKSGDRLVLFGGDDGAEPSLAMSTSIDGWKEGQDSPDQDARRESLRVEYRMLQALHQQALSLLETAEKLRQLEQTLSELQQRTDALSKAGGAALPDAASTPESASAPANPAPAPAPVPAAKPAVQASAASTVVTRESHALWFYFGLGAVLALVCAWLFWRYRRNQMLAPDYSRLPPDLIVDPVRGSETLTDPLDIEEHAAGVKDRMAARKLDVQFEETSPPPELQPKQDDGEVHSSQLSVAAATVDEHFEVNPVMELADIMLSFGRVKGAAQALQEFVDHSPEEALQPWIRLMDVYRMAGMRQEFEQVAANLNQYFNVEVQNWDSANPGTLIPQETPEGGVVREEPLPIEWPSSAKKARSLEDMPHLREQLLGLWYGKECIDFLQGLVRDNRGGLRSGFTIEVVDEILFLTQVQETLLKMDAEAEKKEAA